MWPATGFRFGGSNAEGSVHGRADVSKDEVKFVTDCRCGGFGGCTGTHWRTAQSAQIDHSQGFLKPMSSMCSPSKRIGWGYSSELSGSPEQRPRSEWPISSTTSNALSSCARSPSHDRLALRKATHSTHYPIAIRLNQWLVSADIRPKLVGNTGLRIGRERRIRDGAA